jgi:hypothetical protein
MFGIGRLELHGAVSAMSWVVVSSMKSELLQSDDDDDDGEPQRLLASVVCVYCVGCQGRSVCPATVVLRDSCRGTCSGFRPVSR